MYITELLPPLLRRFDAKSCIIMEVTADQAKKNHMLLPSSSPVVAVAISGKKNSKYIIRWSLEKFLPEGIIDFKLLHFFPRITSVPTPSKPCNFFFFFLVKMECVFGILNWM